MDPKQFGPFLAQARKEKGLTQAQLAQALGVTNGAVSKWERCLCLPDVSKLADIAQTLDLDVLEVLKAERLPPEAPDRETQVYSTTLETATRQSRRRLKRWITAIAATAVVILLGAFFPVWRIALVWEPSYFETGEVSQLAYIGVWEDRKLARQILAQVEEAFSTVGLTWDEAQAQFGILGRFCINHPDAVSERHSLELWSAHFQLTTGTMWVYYSREGLDANGTVVQGSWRVPSLWRLKCGPTGQWEVVSIKEHP